MDYYQIAMRQQARIRDRRIGVRRESNKANIEFMNQRFGFLEDSISEYLAELQKNPVELLKVKSENTPKDEEEEYESEILNEPELESNEIQQDILKAKALKIQQQVSLIRNVAGFVETDLHLEDASTLKSRKSETQNPPRNDQEEELRLSTLKHQWHLYKKFSLNMDYQHAKLEKTSNQQIEERMKPKRLFKHKLFEINDAYDPTSMIDIVSITNTTYSLPTWLFQFENNTKPIEQLQFTISSFKDVVSFQAFDDFLVTLFLTKTNCHFKKISISLDFSNNLSILCFLRIILLVKSCNIFSISSISRAPIDLNKVKEILLQIFFLIFSMQNLQEVRLDGMVTLFQVIATAFKRADPEKSNISSIVLGYVGGEELNTNHLAELFNAIALLPKLINFECDHIELSGNRLYESFTRLISKLHSARMNLQIHRSFPVYFPMVNIINCNVRLTLEPQMFNEDLIDTYLSSFKDSIHMKYFQLQFFVQKNYQERRSRKDIQREGRERNERILMKKRQNKQQHREESNEEHNRDFEEVQFEENEVELNEPTCSDAVKNQRWFNHFSHFSNLQLFKVNIPFINQKIYDSVLDLLSSTPSITQFSFGSRQVCGNKDYTDDFEYEIEVKNVYSILNNLANIKSFTLYLTDFSCKYSLPSEKATKYHLNVHTASMQGTNSLFNNSLYSFSMDKVDSINIIVRRMTSFKQLDALLESVSFSTEVKQIEINVHGFQFSKKTLEQNQVVEKDLIFFKHFDSLKFVEHLKLNVPIDQHILDSIQAFLRGSQKLKSFIFKRHGKHFRQYYLDYSGFLSAIQESKSIQQLYLRSGIEEISHPLKKEFINNWQKDQVTQFYSPLSEFLRNAPETLRTIEFCEKKANKDGLKLVIESLIKAPILLYAKFNRSTVQGISNSQDSELIDLFNEAVTYGIIMKQNYKFPLSQDTHFEEDRYYPSHEDQYIENSNPINRRNIRCQSRSRSRSFSRSYSSSSLSDMISRSSSDESSSSFS